MKQVLLVDDDRVTHSAVKNSLGDGFALVSCYSLKEANEILDKKESFSIYLIDRALPDGDGLSLCNRIRSDDHSKATPIIFLSQKTSESDKVSGLYAGADDYISKPFGPLELRARVEARLRQSPKLIAIGALQVDNDAQRVFRISETNRVEITLTRLEYKLLVCLMNSKGKILNRDFLLDAVWGPNCNLSDRVVDTHLSHLRKKIAGTGVVLESLRGEGYRLTEQSNKSNQAA